MNIINGRGTMTQTGPLLVQSSETAEQLLHESLGKPHEGRMYDYYLGGSNNYAVDREHARRVIDALPSAPWAAIQNRKLVARMVAHMVKSGVRQFVDFGSGLPTQGTVHEVAQRHTGDECRVVYVDHDPVASAHSYLLLQKADALRLNTPITGDVLDHYNLWDAITDNGLIDPRRPVGLLMAALFHFVSDEQEPRRSLSWYREKVVPGSFLALSHISTDGMPDSEKKAWKAVQAEYKQATTQVTIRTREEIAEFFGSWDLLEPGLVWTPDWHTDLAPAEVLVGDIPPWQSQIVAGLARKP